jgi:hypothetical protein
LEIDKLVFLDKVSINCVVVRLCGWCDKHVWVGYVFDARFECSFIFVIVRFLGVSVSITFRGVLNGMFLVCV